MKSMHYVTYATMMAALLAVPAAMAEGSKHHKTTTGASKTVSTTMQTGTDSYNSVAPQAGSNSPARNTQNSPSGNSLTGGSNTISGNGMMGTDNSSGDVTGQPQRR